ncbi:Gp37 family protein [Thiothrix nivea]|uniref:Gp37 protein n=1 Tax=Thiothrix nivea (strain ATCC 35100 / DSM 5205 / JP2) TaxID=870187 RepID=A0A656H960_THINJ|nr:Gp37 family protein [Thiothrix nivea]EIJ33321.1 Protein of unknown function Gp37 [Thiothrix nivea DSM 5205]
MSLLELEQAILGKLAATPQLSALKVEPYPERPSEYRLMNPKGAVLVVVQGSRYSQAIGGVQARKTRIIITLLVRNLNSHAGAYVLLDAVLASLAGWCPGDGWYDLAAQSENFVTEDNGVWQYDVVFEVESKLVSAYGACGE